MPILTSMTAAGLGLLFVGAIAAAAISGSVGFGGALLLLPLLTRSVGPEVGVPLLTVAQLVGHLSRALFGFRVIAWRIARTFLVAAVPAAVLGSLCFVAPPRSVPDDRRCAADSALAPDDRVRLMRHGGSCVVGAELLPPFSR